MKTCNMCKQRLPYEKFHKSKSVKDGYNRRCKSCTLEYNRQLYKNPEYRKKRLEYQKVWDSKNKTPEKRKMKQYGLSESDYKNLIDKYDGKCHICLERDGGYIDHCHESGLVRGFLCLSCNTALGNFQDRPELLQSAIKYLQAGVV